MGSRRPRPPAGLGVRGKRFWTRTVADNLPTDTELELLTEVCRALDTVDDLQAVIVVEGVTATGSTGQRVVHPAVAEIRQTRLALGRLLAQLAIPDDEEATLDSPSTVRARTAAQARWAKRDAAQRDAATRRSKAGS